MERIMKGLLILVFCLWGYQIHAQEILRDNFSKELSFTNDNDAYLLQKNDAYYTNGLFFSFAKAKEKNGRKLINHFEIGQKIFTPLNRKVENTLQIDRPYCGLLSFKFSQTKFLKDESVWQYRIGFYQTGDASFGESVQNAYHKLFKYARFNAWYFQVQDAFAFDLNINYARTIYEDTTLFKIMPNAELTVGTAFINAGIGITANIGKFEKNSNSALWNARIQSKASPKKSNRECFFYMQPKLLWQGYNITVQGNMLQKDAVAKLQEPARWVFQHTMGICYATGRWTTKAAWIYQTIEAQTQIRDQQYGSLSLSYRLH